MTIMFENFELLSDLLTLGAPVLLGIAAAAYLALLLSWQQTRDSKGSTTSTKRQ